MAEGNLSPCRRATVAAAPWVGEPSDVMFDDVPDFTTVMPVSGGGLGTGIIYSILYRMRKTQAVRFPSQSIRDTSRCHS